MGHTTSPAPGAPGSPPTWTTGAKLGVGTAIAPTSRVWFTLADGILTEVYYPSIDRAATRDLGFIVTDGCDFFSEERRDAQCKVELLQVGVPGYRLTNTCSQGRYRIEKEIVCDSNRDVVLQRVRFEPLVGKLQDYRLYALLAPRLDDQGSSNTALLGEHKGRPLLLAEHAETALALGSSASWLKRSVGYVGVSDGWQDLRRHKRLTWANDEARSGNVALVGEIDLAACGGRFVLALGFGRNTDEAAHFVHASLFDDFAAVRSRYIDDWKQWLDSLRQPAAGCDIDHDLYRFSAAAVRVHEAKHCLGAFIASLSIPWGAARGDQEQGGYHLVWVRDMVEAAGGLLAVREHAKVRDILGYLRATQEADGSWPQNMWAEGGAYWQGRQMDEIALVVLLAGLADREGALTEADVVGFWPMLRKATRYLIERGPATEQDRWEANPGYTPFTLAAEVAALLVAADMAEARGEAPVADYLRATADAWNESIERWTYASNGKLRDKCGVDGYYVRVVPPASDGSEPSVHQTVRIKNQPDNEATYPADEIVSIDALALVRFGLRAVNDPRVDNTRKVIDATLRSDLPQGLAWHRYSHDGYGEHADGTPFDRTGIGRAWPLSVGERAHYELAGGRRDEATQLLHTLQSLATEGHLLSEQVWDAADLPSKNLFRGKPTGSSTPLVWAHSEYLKLCRSLGDGRVFDMPPQTIERYLVQRTAARHTLWRFERKPARMPQGKILRIEMQDAGVVRWSADGWRTIQNQETVDSELGIQFADLATSELSAGTTIQFTVFWPRAGRWEDKDFAVVVENSVK